MATPNDVDLAKAAIRLGLLNKEQARECLKIAHALALKGTPRSIADIFVEQSLLSHEQVKKLLTQVSAPPPPPTSAQPPSTEKATTRTPPPQIKEDKQTGAASVPHTSPPQIGIVRHGSTPRTVQSTESQTRTAGSSASPPFVVDRRTGPQVSYPPIIERRKGAPLPGEPAQQSTKPPSSQVQAHPIQPRVSTESLVQARQPCGTRDGSQAQQITSGMYQAPQSPSAVAPAGKQMTPVPTPQTHKVPTPLQQQTQKTPAAPAKPAQPQDPIPGYKIIGKIGVGGMATVFKALDSRNANRVVALKILFPHHAKNEVFLQRFIREAKLLIQFNHVNIVRGYDWGVANTLYYLAMEYIEGKSVQNMIDEQGSLEEELALDIILQIARALAYIQEQGIVHRDVKPDNVLMTADGVVKLCDLGFAKPLGGPPGVGAAATEDVTCGTPQYMSPEQAQGEVALDIRSDIYALGATLYHMVLGTLPFKGTDNMEIMAKQVLESLDSAEVKSRKISKHMHYFIERMMSKDKNFRYQSPQELVEDIETQMEGWRTLHFNPDEVEISLGGFLKKPVKGQLTPRQLGSPTQSSNRGSTRFLRRKF